MANLAGAQATAQLTDFLAAVSAAPDEPSAARAAVEWAALALAAEVGVALFGATTVAVGFAAGQTPVTALAEAVRDHTKTIDVPGAGECHVAAADLSGRSTGHLLLARSWDAFSVEEINLVRAMTRVLSLTLDMIHTIEAERTLREQSQRQAAENSRLVSSLRERQRLVDALSAIERGISRRAPLQQILDIITDKARQLLGDDVALLRLIDSDAPDELLLASAAGSPQLVSQQPWRVSRLGTDLCGSAIAGNDLVAVTGCGDPRGTLATAVAAPVHENGSVVGSLLVASTAADREYTDADRQTLRAFAEHASLALTDARTVEAMREAFHDALTGLASRALFLNRLEHQIATVARDNTPLGVLFIDLNRFKVINDTLGHAAGDQLLVEVAQRIVHALRTGDTAARFGGDEFAALLVNVGTEEALGIADRIIDAIRQPFEVEGKQVFVNASVGVAIHSPGQEANDLLRDADVAMYRAKRAGEGRRELFRPAMHAELLARVQLETELRHAIDNDQLTVHYQPIVALSTGTIKGFEALTRWTHPERGPVPPTDFIPLAEETGLILAIGNWVLREACLQVHRWQRDFPDLPPLAMNVNLSARQLQQPGLLEEVREALTDSGVEPEHLVLEITESLLHQDVDEAVARLHGLKGIGVRLAIDDFGTGYSSLSCLHRFPVDIMKIDKSFVQGLISGRRRATSFVHAIVRLGRMLDLETVAEGIESAEQLSQLRGARCEYGQGYYYARPLDADQAAEYLRATRHRMAQPATENAPSRESALVAAVARLTPARRS